LASISAPVERTSPSWTWVSGSSGLVTVTFCLVIWNTEAVMRPSKAVGSYFTPASNWVPVCGLKGSPIVPSTSVSEPAIGRKLSV